MLIDYDGFIISTTQSCFVACCMIIVYIYTTQHAFKTDKVVIIQATTTKNVNKTP